MAQLTPTATRTAGLMLPLASLPSPYGVGDMGPEAYRFVDLLSAHGIRHWQILPINPLGFGNSPYQPYSSFAGDPLFISPQLLAEEGLLADAPPPHAAPAATIDYPAARAHKDVLLREAFAAFVPDADYAAFSSLPWAYPFAVFMTFKRLNGLREWLTWPEAQKNWPYERAVDLAPYDEDIRFELFCQHMFLRQWMRLKAYANEKGVAIIGDIPIYVGIDSQDVWTGRENFLLDAEGNPTHVAGVPPDYFSETGQRWGNPLYDWDHMQADGFSFWIQRLQASMQLFDILRIDHFRAFDTYWKIPASCPTAVEGEWKEAPGYALFDTVMAALPGIQIIAEDLGMLREEVYALRDHYRLRGMKILQFTFVPGQPVDPRADREHMVVYTGTHDNQTMLGWYQDMPLRQRLLARRTLRRAGYRRGKIVERFARLALDDRADMAILPVADVLGLDARARINTPGTVGPPNWEWRLHSLDALQRALIPFAQAARDAGRLR